MTSIAPRHVVNRLLTGLKVWLLAWMIFAFAGQHTATNAGQVAKLAGAAYQQGDATEQDSKPRTDEASKDDPPAPGEDEKPPGKKGKTRAKKAKPSDDQSQQQEDQPAEPLVALVGADIDTQTTRGIVARGVLLIRGDKIEAIHEQGYELPPSATQIDVSGTLLTPGLIDARSTLWLTTAALRASARDASLNVLDGLDPFSEQWQDVLRQGITSVYVQPSSAGNLGGYGAVVSVAPKSNEATSDDSVDVGPEVLHEYAALQASLGVSASSNRTRQQQWDRTRKVFEAAQAYQKKWDEYEAYLKKKKEQQQKTSADEQGKTPPPKSKSSRPPESTGTERPTRRRTGRPAGPPAEVRKGTPTKPALGGKPEQKGDDEKEADKKSDKAPEKPDCDPAKDRLVQVLKGEIPLRLEIHSADDAHYALQMIDKFEDLQIVFEGLRDLGSSREDILDLGLPVVAGPWLQATSSFAANGDDAAAWQPMLNDYAGTLSIASFGSRPRSSRFLRTHLAAAIAGGMSPQRALAGVTVDAARCLGISDTVGSIQAGKQADVVCFAGDPTSPATQVRLVMVRGQIAYQSPEATDADETEKTGWATKLLEPAEPSLPGVLPDSYLLKSTRCLMPDGSWQARILGIQDGRIRHSMKLADASDAPDWPVIDAGDAAVTPGLFSAHANLNLQGLVDPRAVDAGYVVAGDSMTPDFEGERQLVEEGLIRAILAPGDRNPVAGSASLVRLGREAQVGVRQAATKLVLSSDARSSSRFPSSLAGQLQLLHQSWSGTLLTSRVVLPDAVADKLRDQRAQVFQSLQDGQLPALIVAETDAEIDAALRLTDRYRLKSYFVGAEQLAPFAEQLHACGAVVVARPMRPDDFDWYPQDLAMLAESDVPLLFAGENAWQLRLTAALAVEAGLSPDTALKQLCYGKLLSQTVLEWSVDSPADLVVWTESPLHLAARPLAVILQGQRVAQEKSQP